MARPLFTIFGMRARHRFLIDLNVGLGRAPNHQRRRFQVVLAAQIRPVDDHQARLLDGRLLSYLVDTGDDRFRPNAIGVYQAVGWFRRNPWHVKTRLGQDRHLVKMHDVVRFF